VAGFFEGEGTVHRQRDKRTGKWQHTIVFYQVNPEPLAKVHAVCGGSVSVRRWRGTNPNAQPCMMVRVGGERAIALARALAPLLSSKRRAQLAPLLERPPRRAQYAKWSKLGRSSLGKRWIVPTAGLA
jgi:hypothetical protein